MKAILISLPPEQVARILNKKQTIIIQKTFPKCKLPIEVYIYCTKGIVAYLETDKEKPWLLDGHYVCYDKKLSEKVVAKFTLEEFDENYTIRVNAELMKEENRISLSFENVLDGLKKCTAKYCIWNISNLQIFDKPKEIIEFFEPYECGGLLFPLTNPPKTWRYIG